MSDEDTTLNIKEQVVTWIKSNTKRILGKVLKYLIKRGFEIVRTVIISALISYIALFSNCQLVDKFVQDNIPEEGLELSGTVELDEDYPLDNSDLVYWQNKFMQKDKEYNYCLGDKNLAQATERDCKALNIGLNAKVTELEEANKLLQERIDSIPIEIWELMELKKQIESETSE